MTWRERSELRKKIKREKILMFFIGAAFLFFCSIMVVSLVDGNKYNQEKAARKERLEENIESEKQRSAELDEYAVYVTTKQYIIEKAKTLGFVYISNDSQNLY